MYEHGKVTLKHYVILYIIFCLIGAGLEWSYGALWNIVGTTPWLYPDSPLRYTSFEGVPLWGFGGLVCVSVYNAIIKREVKKLLGVIPPLLLAALLIIFYGAI
jgi:hypothetical protein